MKLFHGIYKNVQSQVGVNEGPSDEFEVKVSVHHCSSLSYLRLCHRSFELEYLGRTFMLMTLSVLLTPWKNVLVNCCLGRTVWRGRG